MKQWRDIGGGKVRCDSTGEIGILVRGHSVVPVDEHRRTITFTRAEWSKLEALARKRTSTPAECLRDFVRRCQSGGGGWVAT